MNELKKACIHRDTTREYWFGGEGQHCAKITCLLHPNPILTLIGSLIHPARIPLHHPDILKGTVLAFHNPYIADLPVDHTRRTSNV